VDARKLGEISGQLGEQRRGRLTKGDFSEDVGLFEKETSAIMERVHRAT
jgi:hypothetical protein